MRQQMFFQSTWISAGTVAMIAAKLCVTCMDSLVFCQVTFIVEGIATEIAGEGFVSAMDSFVNYKSTIL